MARQKEPTYITEDKPFSVNLRGLMFDKKTSQTELAAHVKCTRQAISLYATGQSTPDIDILVKMAKYFEVSTDYLLGLTTTKTSDVKIKNICKYTGLSENAVNGIISINNEIHLQETKDILNEILISGKFKELICDIVLSIDHYFNKKRLGIKRSLTDFDYQLWIANKTAAVLIDRVIESYYLKNKDKTKKVGE